MNRIRLILQWFRNLFHKAPAEPEALEVPETKDVRVIPYRGRVKLTEELELPAGFHPSPVMQVKFADGEVIPMSRKVRRFNHLYGDRLVRTRR